MLTLNYRYRLYPDATQEQQLIEWMEICRRAFNYGLREIKDWCNIRIHNCDNYNCDNCGYQKDRDVAAGENIRNRGIKLISTQGHCGTETACANGLPGTELKPQSRQVLQSSHRGITRKSESRDLEASAIANLGA
jgi:transposase